MIDKQKAVFSMVPVDGTVSDNNSSWRLYNAWARVNGLGLRMHTSTWKAVIKIRLHYNATSSCCMCASLHLKWAISPQTELLLPLHMFSGSFWVTCLYLCERAHGAGWPSHVAHLTKQTFQFKRNSVPLLNLIMCVCILHRTKYEMSMLTLNCCITRVHLDFLCTLL